MATIVVSSETLQQWTETMSALRGVVAPAEAETIDTLLVSMELMRNTPAVEAPSKHSENVRETVGNVALDQLAQWQLDGTWDAMTQFASLLTAVKSSATAPMAERLGMALTTLGNLVSRVTGEDSIEMLTSLFDHPDTLTGVLEQLATWQSDGTWQRLLELVTLLMAVMDSLSIATIERLTATTEKAGRTLSTVMDSRAVPISMALLDAMTDAWQDALGDRKSLTLVGMLRLIKEPPVQLSLKTLFGVLKKMPQVLEAE